ncbi:MULTISPECIES: hypothetical protein [Helicobacter]|uniref:hypothetical protein n=1 Tax=Helicobacter TaxID=209 RepID=UPI0023F0185B|nr:MULTISPECIES: hypothetical protein [Helicobacter]
MKHKDHYNDAYIVELSQKILSVMPEFEAQKFVQKSVGNNLNDLFKESPQKAQTLIAQWRQSGTSKACEWIIKHGERRQNKNQQSLV